MSKDSINLDNLDIVFSGPFRTDIFLDFRHLTAVGYEESQDKIKEVASKGEYGFLDWSYPKLEAGQIHKLGNFGRGKTIIPRYYMGCTMNDFDNSVIPDWIEDSFTINCEELLGTEYNARIKWFRVRVYEFGFGSVSMCINLSCVRNSENISAVNANDLQKVAVEASNMIENNSTEWIHKIILNIIGEMRKCIEKFDIKQFPTLDKEFDATNIWSKIGEVMWTHRLFCYTSKNKNLFDSVSNEMDVILSKTQDNSFEYTSSVLKFGVANSIVISLNDSDQNKWIRSRENLAFESASRVIQAANVYYAVAQYLDNSLFWFLNYSVDSAKNEKSVKRLRKMENEITEHIQFSYQYRALIDQYKFYLNPVSKNIWDRVVLSWELQERLEVLDKQINNAVMLYDRIVNEITAARQGMLNIIATVFTGISAVALIEISQAPEFRWPNAEVFLVIIITAVVAVVFVFVFGLLDSIKKYWHRFWSKLRRK